MLKWNSNNALILETTEGLHERTTGTKELAS